MRKEDIIDNDAETLDKRMKDLILKEPSAQNEDRDTKKNEVEQESFENNHRNGKNLSKE